MAAQSAHGTLIFQTLHSHCQSVVQLNSISFSGGTTMALLLPLHQLLVHALMCTTRSLDLAQMLQKHQLLLGRTAAVEAVLQIQDSYLTALQVAHLVV